MEAWILALVGILHVAGAANSLEMTPPITQTHNGHKTFSCSCQMTLTGHGHAVVHDLGEFTLRTRVKHRSLRTCHQAKHLCAEQCDKKARDLSHHTSFGPLRKRFDGNTFGYRICMFHFKEVFSQSKTYIATSATVSQCESGIHKHGIHNRHLAARWSERVCCGLSYFTLEDGKSALVLGWNPDCEGKEYIIAD